MWNLGHARNFETAGVIAQLGERFNGIEEVGGSIPPGSTNTINKLETEIRFSIDCFGDKSPPRRHYPGSLPAIGNDSRPLIWRYPLHGNGAACGGL
jgi:hypothetical protein